ncbi:MAG TPA: adenylyl-sulfate kinase [Pseudonocardiaceae bacterium]|nr:adenylyl-sulfate kinase [Pseudonocardiaceae bacterium]
MTQQPDTARPHGGVTVWLTGLPGAGKTTIAETIAALVDDSVEVELLDGDELRRTLSADLGFSRQDRETHVRRVGFVAELLTRHGVLTLVPVIAPYATARAAVREHHQRHGSAYVEVHVATPVEECMRRDPKGLYARARAGQLPGLTGVDDRYEQPSRPELRLDTTDIDPTTAARRILDLLPTD